MKHTCKCPLYCSILPQVRQNAYKVHEKTLEWIHWWHSHSLHQCTRRSYITMQSDSHNGSLVVPVSYRPILCDDEIWRIDFYEPTCTTNVRRIYLSLLGFMSNTFRRVLDPGCIDVCAHACCVPPLTRFFFAFSDKRTAQANNIV